MHQRLQHVFGQQLPTDDTDRARDYETTSTVQQQARKPSRSKLTTTAAAVAGALGTVAAAGISAFSLDPERTTTANEVTASPEASGQADIIYNTVNYTDNSSMSVACNDSYKANDKSVNCTSEHVSYPVNDPDALQSINGPAGPDIAAASTSGTATGIPTAEYSSSQVDPGAGGQGQGSSAQTAPDVNAETSGATADAPASWGFDRLPSLTEDCEADQMYYSQGDDDMYSCTMDAGDGCEADDVDVC